MAAFINKNETARLKYTGTWQSRSRFKSGPNLKMPQAAHGDPLGAAEETKSLAELLFTLLVVLFCLQEAAVCRSVDA